ncbi:5-dehydro-2-deoxygluconokinase [Lachnospiraceae bacterium ZAX-1]
MNVIKLDNSRPMDLILLGRVTIDFNPVDYFHTLAESTTFRKYVGGSPANIAIGLSRHGLKTGFFGRVSADQFGDFVVDFFKKEGVDTSRIVRCTQGEKLGLTFTEILSPTQSSILMYRNQIADLQLSVEDIDEGYIKNAKGILISGTALAESPSREAALKAMMLAKRNNTIIIFDIDYREYNWKNKDELSIYYSIVAKNADIIMGSREEFDLTEKLIQLGRTDEETAEFWCNEMAKIVVIKHGKEGSTAYTEDGNKYSVKPFPVKALKSFGGGDGYGAGFLYGIYHDWDILDCLEFGSAEASMMVRSHSCTEELPNPQQVREFIDAVKAEHGVMAVKL